MVSNAMHCMWLNPQPSDHLQYERSAIAGTSTECLLTRGVHLWEINNSGSDSRAGLIHIQAAQAKGASSACSAYINLFHVPHILSNQQNIRVYKGMKQIPLKLLQIRNNSK